MKKSMLYLMLLTGAFAKIEAQECKFDINISNHTDEKSSVCSFQLKGCACKFDYPKEASDKGIEGTVYLSVKWNQDNNTFSDLKVVKGLGYGLDDLALNIAAQLEKEIKSKGYVCSGTITLNLPIRFKIQ